MPGINNISNVNNLDSPKVVSKLSFQVGEIFQAKVVEVKNQGNEVTLKTQEGWQFAANSKIPLDMLPKGLVKFKVVGYEDGKLQIEVVPEVKEGTSVEEKSIQTILKQQNLSSNKADLEMLKSMVSHDIPLTKANISAIKTIIDFKEKISTNVKEEDIFINKYLQSKGIDANSVEGKNAIITLKGFFSELKKASVEDIATLIENGVDITEDNLKSFNNVFKKDTGLYKQITQDMNKEILKANNGAANNSVPKETQELKIVQTILKNEIPVTKENISTVKVIIDLKEQILAQPKNEAQVIKSYLESKNIPEDSEKGKVISNNIKEFFETVKNTPIKEVLAQLQSNIGEKGEILGAKLFKDDLPVFKEVIQDVLKNMDQIKESQPTENKSQIPIKTNNPVPKETQELKIAQTILENGIPVTKENISTVKAIIDLKEQILAQPKNEVQVIKSYLENKNIPEDSEKGKAISNNIKEFFETVKNTPIKEVLSQLQSNIDGKVEIPGAKLFKEDLPVFKEVIQDVLKNMDQIKESQPTQNKSQIPIKTNNPVPKETQEVKIVQTILENEIPVTRENVSTVKAIIDLKEQILTKPKNEAQVIKSYLESKNIPEDSAKGKAISKNIKEFFEMVKSTPIKEVLSNLQPTSEAEGVDLKNFTNQIKEDLPLFKEIIKNILKGDELPKGNQLAESIKSQLAQKTDFMKDVIKSMADGNWSEMKSGINDVKVFNTVSNQYYYMDVPVNINQNQYECKLLIKDDRKKGKKIDSKNVKMLVSVKTINIGKVDVYIKVSDRNINIDLKCNENWMKVFKNETNKLLNTLQDMKYNVNLNIEKQIDEANIVTSREFFQDNELGSLNVMV